MSRHTWLNHAAVSALVLGRGSGCLDNCSSASCNSACASPRAFRSSFSRGVSRGLVFLMRYMLSMRIRRERCTLISSAPLRAPGSLARHDFFLLALQRPEHQEHVLLDLRRGQVVA